MVKPNIEEVYDAFCRFQHDSRHAGVNMQKHAEARERLKAAFDGWGLAELVDWTDRGAS